MKAHKRALIFLIGVLGFLAASLSALPQSPAKQPVPPTYFHPKSNELATAFGEAVVNALYGKGQPKPLLDEAAAKMDKILKD